MIKFSWGPSLASKLLVAVESKIKLQQKGKSKHRGHETDTELSYLLKTLPRRETQAVNDGNIATQKVVFYPIPGRSAML